MRRWPPILGSLLVLLATGCTTVGPATPVAGPTTGAPPDTDYSTVDSQYRGIQVGLNLPPGKTFPAHLPSSASAYPSNAGTVMAQNYWFCSWLRAWLAGTSGAADELPKYTRMDAYTKGLDDHGRATVDGALTAIHDKKRSSVTGFVNASCGGPFYSQA